MPSQLIRVAAGLWVREGSEVLAGFRPPGSHLEGTLVFPGGKIEADENPQTAVRREFLEETGFDIESWEFVLCNQHAYPERTVELHWFLAQASAGIKPVTGPQVGRTDHKWKWRRFSEFVDEWVPDGNKEILLWLGKNIESLNIESL